MAALTEERNTKEVLDGGNYTYLRVVGGTANIYAGALVAQNADGKAVPASQTASIVVIGRAQNSAAPGENVRVRRGVYLYENGTSTEAITVSSIGGNAKVIDDQTVGVTGGTAAITAGVILDVTADGVTIRI